MPQSLSARPWHLSLVAVMLVLWHAALALDYVNLRFSLGLDLPQLLALLPLDALWARVAFTMAVWLGLAGAVFMLFGDDAAVLLLFAAALGALIGLAGGGLPGGLALVPVVVPVAGALQVPVAVLVLVPALGWFYARALKRAGALH
ncbi:MAG: hypothetical protein ACK4LQ_01950 [Pararhodobacter sp.]